VASASLSAPILSFAALALVMAFKHFVADFLLQTNWIAQGKERNEGWLAPLAVHVFGHALLTLCIVLVLAPKLWWLAVLEFFVHGAIDHAKTVIGNRGGWQPNQQQYWWLLGFDQFLHQATNIALAAAILLL
jgi:Protein of unknown function (DUF3307)